jgi:hypothetical protein
LVDEAEQRFEAARHVARRFIDIAGGDAFLCVFVHFQGLDVQRTILQKFTQFASPGSVLRARSLASASIVITLSGEGFPSDVKLLQADLVPVAKSFAEIMMPFDQSPFVEKVRQVRSLCITGPPIDVTLVRALRLARVIWVNGKVSEDPMSLLHV